MNKEENIQFFENALMSVKREGCDMAAVIERLKKWEFYEAPASTNFHLNEPGGLLQHSINVYKMAKMLKSQVILEKPELEPLLNDDEITIAALLHDVCKCKIYVLEEKFKKEDGRWVTYQGYNVDYSVFPVGHGEKSIIMLLYYMGLRMTQNEILAIRWHMSAWDLPFQSSEEKSNLNAAKDKCPLVSLIQAADGLAAGLLEPAFR